MQRRALPLWSISPLCLAACVGNPLVLGVGDDSAESGGGTAAQVLRRIACDLLVVKPPGFVSPLLVTED